MPGKDLFPDAQDEQMRGRFRMSNNRKVEIILQQELDDVAKKSITQINAFKEARNNVPLTEEKATARKLAPEFAPSKVREKRKSKPVFHEEDKPRDAKNQKSVIPSTVPPYNALDREGSIIKLTEDEEKKLKKYPFSKDKTVTVQEMRKPRISTVGIVPARQSGNVDGLNIMMKGKVAVHEDYDPVLGAVERANTAPLIDVSTEELISDSKPSTPKAGYKPAIVGMAGTLTQAVFAKRPEPPVKPRTYLKSYGMPRREVGSAKSDGSSFESVDLTMADEHVYREYDAAIQDIDVIKGEASTTRTSEGRRTEKGVTSVTSIKSTKDLLEEAKQIIGGSPKGPRHKDLQRKPSQLDSHSRKLSASKSKMSMKFDKRSKGTKSKSSKHTLKEEEPSAERTVDEIIASLKENATSNIVSESDKKIQAIMMKVMTRNKPMFGDLDDELSSHDKEMEAAEEVEVLEQEMKQDSFAEEDENAEEEEEEIEKAEDEQTDRQTSTEDPMIDEALDKLSQAAEAANTSPLPGIQVQFEEDEEEEEDEDVLDTPDLHKAWEDFNMPKVVTYEDIVSINAKQMELEPRQQAVEEGGKTKSSGQAPVHSQSVSFLSSWAPADKKDVEKTIEQPQLVAKNVHHFCTATEDVMLPDHYRGTWRRYHVPSKYDNFYKAITQQSEAPSVSPSTHTDVTPNSNSSFKDNATDISKQRSEVAKRILEEANTLETAERHLKEQQEFLGMQSKLSDQKSEFDTWQRKAQELFDQQGTLEIDGKKVPLKADESYLYWTPAPPKWDMTPAAVKKELFPKYNGAALAHDMDSTMITQEELAETEEEEETKAETDPAEKAAKNRTLRRNYPSMQDLTEGREPVGKTKFMLNMALDLNFEEHYSDAEHPVTQELAKSIEQQIMEIMKIDPRLKNMGILEFKISGAFSEGSVIFKLQVKTAKPLRRSDIEEVSQLLKQDIETYGPLEVNGEEVALKKDPEVHPSERMSALEILKERTFENIKLPGKVPRGGTPYYPAPQSVRREVTENEVISSRPIVPPIPRTTSAPGGLDNEDDDLLLIYQDFDATFDEIMKQKKQVKAGKKAQAADKQADVTEEITTEVSVSDDVTKRDESLAGPPSKMQYFAQAMQQADEPTPAEQALEAGRNYVILPKKKKNQKKHARKVDVEAIERLEKFLAQKSRHLSRRESMCFIKKPLEWELRVPPKVRTKRRGSLPDRLEFEEYKKNKHFKVKNEENEREWVRKIWNHWFDQVYPPTPVESDWSSDEEEETDEASVMKESPQRRTSVASTVYEAADLEVEPVIVDEEDEETIELLAEEIEDLTAAIETTEHPRAFDLCRRGAIYRKLGKIKPAMDDLKRAIEMEPNLVDAYWHRHFVYILLNKKQAALEDLNFILRTNKGHAEAYKSRAKIFRQLGDLTMAVVNFTQAIKIDNRDYESYFQRAEMYEKQFVASKARDDFEGAEFDTDLRGELLLAMEDYATATRISPQKTEALYRHGLHYFKNKNWKNAIQDFTDLLKRKPIDAKTRLLRGRCHVQLKDWNRALEDMSAAIHLDPKNSKAFYYRGCILRKLHPKKALQDFSISLLLDDSEDNILSYLHRGILYNDIGKHDDAIPDFEAVLKLNKDMACAHVNLGLIYMLKMENHHRAIKKFTSAMKADPTYVKAYLCRAEAYTKIHDIKNALLDITRAIHIRPDVHHYYMYRGELVRKMGDLDLAAFCVKHAAELDEDMGKSPTQKAIVQSFLKNYDKAIEALESASRVKPVAPIFILLGKTLMKARRWKKAIESFEKALEIVKQEQDTKLRLQKEAEFDLMNKKRFRVEAKKKKPWQQTQTWPMEAAEMYYLIGMCFKEMRDFPNAHEGFSNAIMVDKKYAEAYYHRGLAKVKLKQPKGIQDFNRALALQPKLFEAYLSRAAYYGLRKQFTKAILNCNEAIRLQPNSVRSYLYRGALKYHIKAYRLAIRDLSHAITIDNMCALAYFNRAVCHQDSGNWQKALQDYGIVMLLGEALKLKVLINRGLLYFERKDYRNALHDFLIAAEVYPKDKQIHHTLGLCYHKLDRLEEAIKSFTRALELDRFFLDALISRGNVFMDYQTKDGHTYAKHDYERALHFNPLCLPARVNLAYTLQVAGKYQQAWHQFTKAININPRFKPALEGRAIINLQMSDTFAAYQDISGAISVRPTAELLTNRGVIHQFMGERHNAMKDYQAAIKQDPAYALAYFNAANMYFHMRQFKQGLEYYDITLQLNGKDESAYLNRAITKVMLKDAKGALSDFDRAVRISPYSAHIYFNRANLYASLSMLDHAERDYTKTLQLHPDDPIVHKRRADVRGKLGKKESAIEDYRHAINIQTRKRILQKDLQANT